MRARVDLVVEGARVPGGRRRFERDLRRVAAWAAARAGRPVALSVAVVDDARMRTVNARHLGHDHATDVLAFPMAAAPILEGELLLSAETARREAARRGHPAYHELALYAVHGVLHLLGHDDHGPRERRRMRRGERTLLGVIGLPPVFASGARSQADRAGDTGGGRTRERT